MGHSGAVRRLVMTLRIAFRRTSSRDRMKLLRSLAVTMLVVGSASATASAQNQRGTLHGTDSSGAKIRTSNVSAVRALAGAAQSRVEIDTLDWRPKWTLRLLITEPDTGVIVIRWATSARPTPGTYPVKIVSTGASHADPKFVTATFSVREPDGPKDYVIGEFDNRVVVRGAGADGSLSGTFSLFPTRYATDPRAAGPNSWVNRREEGSFESAPGASAPPPKMTAAQQQRILSRALLGFGITWAGAENGDGHADSTRTPAKARAFLAARWKDALMVDSLALSASDFFLRVRGRIIPVVCTFTPHDYATQCTTPRVPALPTSSRWRCEHGTKQRTRFASGTTATPRKRRGFTPKTFPDSSVSAVHRSPGRLSVGEERGRVDGRVHRAWAFRASGSTADRRSSTARRSRFRSRPPTRPRRIATGTRSSATAARRARAAGARTSGACPGRSRRSR